MRSIMSTTNRFNLILKLYRRDGLRLWRWQQRTEKSAASVSIAERRSGNPLSLKEIQQKLDFALLSDPEKAEQIIKTIAVLEEKEDLQKLLSLLVGNRLFGGGQCIRHCQSQPKKTGRNRPISVDNAV